MEAGKQVKDGGQKVVQLFQKKKSRTNKKVAMRSALNCPMCGSDDVVVSLTKLVRIKSIREEADRYHYKAVNLRGDGDIQFLLCKSCDFVDRYIEDWIRE